MTTRQPTLPAADHPTFTDAVADGGICYWCGARPASPHKGDVVPYCRKHKREHRRRHALTGDG
jgi:hypothetical protein